LTALLIASMVGKEKEKRAPDSLNRTKVG